LDFPEPKTVTEDLDFSKPNTVAEDVDLKTDMTTGIKPEARRSVPRKGLLERYFK